MADERSRLDVVQSFFSGTGFSYDQVVTVCTCGFDRYWKKRIMAAIPPGPVRIMDQASGTGILTFLIARAYPECRVVGVELREEYRAIAAEKARAAGLDNVSFLLGRAEDVVLEQEFDCITSSYLAKYAELDPLIANAARMLRPGGVLVMHDFTYPANPFFRVLWQIYFRTMSMAGTRLYPEWNTVFRELPQFLRESSWQADCQAALRSHGFRDIRFESLTFGAAGLITARMG